MVRGTDGNHAFYLAIPPGFFGTVVGQLKEHGLADSNAGLLAAGGRREAVRARPGLGARAERDAGRGVPAGDGLPDRPLPRQGDRAEHPGDALRQRDVRAAVEQQLRRPRADHDGRGRRHRRPGRLLRRHRRRPRRDPEPPAPADGAGRDGGADVVRGGQPARGEAEAAGEHLAAAPAGPDHRARAVRRRLGRRHRGAGLPRRGRHQAHLEDRDVRGDHPARGEPALGGRAVLPAHRQAARPAGHRGGRGVQEGAAPAVQRDRDRGPDPERAGDPGPARRGHDAAVRRRRCPAPRWRSGT